MKGKIVFGALVLSAALCSQGFGDLFGRISGLNCNGCGTCGVCTAPACCEQPKACAPEPCASACEPCRPRRCDLFRGLRDLFACHQCGKVDCSCEPVKTCAPACEKPACAPACEPCAPACEKPIRRVKRCKAVCEPACEPVKACAPVCEKPACAPACDVGCEAPKCRKCRPVRDRVVCFLNDLFTCRRCKPACEVSCETGCGGCATCGGGAPASPAAPAATPAPAPKPAGEAAPLPIPPAKPDPSASLRQPRNIYQANRSLVQY